MRSVYSRLPLLCLQHTIKRNMATTRKALTIEAAGKPKVVNDKPIPKLDADEILVKVAAVALNPTDWKHLDWIATPGHILGCDYAGVVEKVGSGLTRYKPGDRVAGIVHGADPDDENAGAFSEYTVGLADVSLQIPASVSFADGATFGVAVSTIGQGLYQSLGLPLPDQAPTEKTDLLIYGGSSSMGLAAIQYAKLSGARVAVTSSPKNFDLVKKYGADAAFDYNEENVGKKINEYFGGKLTKVFDTITDKQSLAISNASIGSAGGKISGLGRIEYDNRKDVEHVSTLAYTVFGRVSNLGSVKIPPVPEDRAFAKKFWKLTESLVAAGKILAPPTNIREGHVEDIPKGLDDLRNNRVSGQKIVYILDSSL